MSNKKSRRIVIILNAVWVAVLILFIVLLLTNIPIVCMDGYDVVTNQMFGGCYKDYELILSIAICPLLIWIVTEVILLIFLFKTKSK